MGNRKDGHLNVAIIGCGRVGEREATAVISIPELKLVGVADIGPAFRDKALQMGAKYECDAVHDWRYLVTRDDVDIVIITTPNNTHAEIGLEALSHGKHVLCEKPLATTVESATDMLRMARERGVRLMTNFNHRRHDHNLRAKKMLDQGVIGRPVFLRGRIGHGRFVTAPSAPGRFQCINSWYTDFAQSGGGTMIDNGVHLLDLARWFFGAEFVEAQGYVTHNLDLPVVGIPGDEGAQRCACEDNGFGLFKTGDGRVATIHSSWVQWQGYLHVEIFGSNGSLVINNDQIQGQVSCHFFDRHGDPIENTIAIPALLRPDPSWRLQLQEFLAAIREGREPTPNGFDGLQAVRMVHAVYLSAASGRVEPVDARAPSALAPAIHVPAAS